MAFSGLSTCDFQVGDWVVQPTLARIKRRGETKRVTPRAMEVLVRLAEGGGAVISRNDLLDAVWPRMTVTQDALSQCLVELRKAFGDDSQNPRIIETIPRRGVRLIATVMVRETPSAAEPSGTLSSASTERPPARGEIAATRPAAPRTARQGWLRAGAFSALALGIALAAIAFWPTEPNVGRSIAVLPFGYDGADDTVRSFTSSIHDELLTKLRRIRALDKVSPRAAVMPYHDTDKSVREVGQELGVATVLMGQVYGAGEDVRLNLELIDAKTGTTLWDDMYAATLTADRFFAIQTEITLAIADELDATLSGEELARVREVSTESTLALDFYLSGNDYFRRTERPKALKNAVQQYKYATDEDPEFAEAWARLSIAHLALHFLGVDRSPDRLAAAESAVQSALDLDPNLPEGHIAKANFLSRGLGRYDDSLAEFAAAEELTKQDPDLYFLRAGVYRRLGEWELAIDDIDRALNLDPRNLLYLRQQHISYLFRRDYARAERYLDGILAIAPNDATTHVDSVALDLYRKGDTTRASQYEDTAPTPDYALGSAATHTRWLAAVFTGNYARALNILEGSDEDPVRVNGELDVPEALLIARTQRLAGDQEQQARQQFQFALREIDGRLADIAEEDQPATARLHVLRAEIHAALGNSDEAEWSLSQARSLTDPVWSSEIQLSSIMNVLLPVGHRDQAIEELRDYLAHPPGVWAIEGLRRDPRLAPIRDDARVLALAEKYGERRTDANSDN